MNIQSHLFIFNLQPWQRRSLFLSFFLLAWGWSLLKSPRTYAYPPALGQGVFSIGPLVNRFIDSPSPIKTPSTLGLGVSGEMDITHRGGIEVSFFYYESQYAVLNSGNWLVERAHRIYIPIGFRHWFTDWISLATSFYSSYRIGDFREIYRSPGLHPDTVTSAQDITEYGFDFSVQGDLYRHPKFTVFLDGRFLYPTSDKGGENSRAYVFLLGLKYLVQRGLVR